MPFIRFDSLFAAGLLAVLPLALASAQQPTLPGDVLGDSGAEAQPDRYAVEIILFTYADSVSAGTEVFLPEPVPESEENVDAFAPVYTDGRSMPDATDAGGDQPGADAGDDEAVDEAAVDISQPLEFIVTDAARIEYTPLPPEARSLAAAHERLLLLDAYTPVLWGGWTQLVLEEDDSPAINLRRLGNLPLFIDGDLTLYLGRFVHLVVDIRMDETIASAPGDGARQVYGDARERVYADQGRLGRNAFGPAPRKIVYRISEDRIMRNGDVRYFDHPKFGLIAKLTLVEEPETVEDGIRYLPDLLPGGTAPPENAEPIPVDPRR
jgi:hypothetical protein